VVATPADPSFLSGHTTQAAAFALACLLAAGTRLNAALVAIAITYVVALVAASHLYLQVHFPSDVAAGLMLAVVCVGGLHLMLQPRPGPSR